MDKANNINPDMLIWAREAAGLTLDEAASKLNFASSKNSSAADKLTAIEQALNFPTRNQLFKMATLYQKPLSVFYLNSPPIRSDIGEDFRSVDSNITQRKKALLDTLLVKVRARQELVRSILEDEEYNSELSFVKSLNISAGVNHAVEQIKNTLDFNFHASDRSHNSRDRLFNQLLDKTENIGVFVLLESDLGSWHTRIEENVFRGFAIADNIAPFIVINGNDAHIARSFTLLHELCHIFLGSSSISGALDISHEYLPHNRIENFCNEVASEILLPSEMVNCHDYCESFDKARDVIQKIAHTYSVSESLVTYKFQKLGKIDQKTSNQLFSFYRKRWEHQREDQRQQNKEKRGGPNYYDIRRNHLGKALVDLVSRNLRENELTHTKAAFILGVKPTSVNTLLKL